jgi:kinetochore protein NDC80
MIRQTLGNITNEQFNTRTNESKESVSRLSKLKSSKKDPRPIGEKSYLKETIQYIGGYVNNSGFEIDLKTLKNPINRDTQLLFEFLVLRLDPNFKGMFIKKEEKELKINKKQLDVFNADLLMSLFSEIGYPFTIKKQDLTSPTPYSLPVLYSHMQWLIEIVKYYEQTKNQNNLFNDESKEAEEFFNILRIMYYKFQNEDMSEECIKDYINKIFHEKNERAIDSIIKYEKEISEYNKEITSYNEDNIISQLKEEDKNIKEETYKAKNKIKDYEFKNEEVIIKRKEIEEINIKNSYEINKMLKEREILKKQIENQKISPKEVKKIIDEKNELETFYNELNEKLNILNQEEMSLNMNIKEETEELNSLLNLYSKYLSQIPNIKKSIDKNNLDSDLNEVKSLLNKHKEDVINMNRKNKEDYSLLKEINDRIDWEKQEIYENHLILQKKFEKIKNEFLLEKENSMTNLQQRTINMDNIELEIKKINKNISNENILIDTEKEIENLEIEFEKLKSFHEKEESNIDQVINQTINHLIESKTKSEDSFSYLKSSLENDFNHLNEIKKKYLK